MKYRVLPLLVIALVCLAVPATANIYLKVDGPGQFTVTNTPSDPSFVKVIETAGQEGDQQRADNIQEAVERAEGQFRIPRSLIYSIMRSFNSTRGLIMPLPQNYIEEHGDTIIRQPEKNILVSTEHFRDMLRRYNGNMTLTLAAYYAGPDPVDEVGGIPPEGNVRRFVESVQSTFDKFEQRSAVIYTYRDDNGTLHVVNIR